MCTFTSQHRGSIITESVEKWPLHSLKLQKYPVEVSGIIEMPDIFDMDYNENLSMNPTVSKGRERNVVCSLEKE